MPEQQSLLGLEEEHSLPNKLGLFLSALFLGPLLGLLLFAGITALEPPWRALATILFDALALFWGFVLIFIWWRPPWVRRIYLLVERKIVLAVQIIGGILFLYIAWNVLMG